MMEIRMSYGEPIEDLLLTLYPLIPHFLFKLHLCLTLTEQDLPQSGHLNRRNLHQLLRIDLILLSSLAHALWEDGLLLDTLEKGCELLLALHQ